MSSVALRPMFEMSRAAVARISPPANGWQPIPHINQVHPQGAGKDYVNGAYNCGPAVVAMLARGHGQLKDLNDAQMIQQLGQGIVTQEGTDAKGLAQMLERANVPPAGEALGAGYDDAAVKEHLQQGHKLIAQVRSYDPQAKQSSAHYVLVQGMTPRGNYIVSDPLANKPYVVSPGQLKEAVLKCPPDGGMLLPVSSPAEAQTAAKAPAEAKGEGPAVLPAPVPGVSRGGDAFMGPVAPGFRGISRGGDSFEAPTAPALGGAFQGVSRGGDAFVGEETNANAFTATDEVFKGVDTKFHETSDKGGNAHMRRNEQHNHYHFGVHYGHHGHPAPKKDGKEAAVTPKLQSAEAFANHLLKLKQRGDPKVYDTLALLENSSFEKDKQVLEIIKKSDLDDGGIGKKMTGDGF